MSASLPPASAPAASIDDHGLGRLELIDPREFWASEPGDFTPWLAENLDVLFSQLGIDVGEVIDVRTEVPIGAAGAFKLDVLVVTASGRRIAIENQLETSDHSHLGQLLLYAAGLEADVLVWIATRFRPEYRAALDWLNSHTRSGVHAFGVQLELVRIGDSPLAPVFDVVSEPNDWEEVTKQPSDLNRRRQGFYRQVLELVADKVSAFRMPKAQAESWQAFRSGPFGYYAFAFTHDGKLRVEAYLDAAEPSTLGKQLFDHLQVDADAINEAIKGDVAWERLNERRASRLAVYRLAPDLADSQQVEEAAQWAAARAVEMITALDNRMRSKAKELRQNAAADDVPGGEGPLSGPITPTQEAED